MRNPAKPKTANPPNTPSNMSTGCIPAFDPMLIWKGIGLIIYGIIIVSSVIAKTYDFLLASTVFLGFLIYYHVNISSLIILYPLVLLIQIFFSLGLSFILSAFNLFYRDVQYLMNSVFLIWFYLTPVIYPIELIPDKYKFVFQLNPMSVLINAQRRTIFGGGDLNYMSLTIAIILSLVVFQLGYFIFKKLEGLFADVV